MVGSTLCTSDEAARLRYPFSLGEVAGFHGGIGCLLNHCFFFWDCSLKKTTLKMKCLFHPRLEEAENERMHLLVCMKMFKAAGCEVFPTRWCHIRKLLPYIWLYMPQTFMGWNTQHDRCGSFRKPKSWAKQPFVNQCFSLKKCQRLFPHSAPGWFRDTPFSWENPVGFMG